MQSHACGFLCYIECMIHPEPLLLLSDLFARIAQANHVRLAYLFGSRAVGRSALQSDYDIAVLFETEIDLRKVEVLRHQVCVLLNTDRVDLIQLNRAPVELGYNVIAAGRLLFEASCAARVEFEARTLGLYFDYLPILRRQRTELLKEDNYETGIQRNRTALGKTEELLAQIGTSEK